MGLSLKQNYSLDLHSQKRPTLTSCNYLLQQADIRMGSHAGVFSGGGGIGGNSSPKIRNSHPHLKKLNF